jgi:predicted PolB exonuclease-like 3'-5' exonuclease
MLTDFSKNGQKFNFVVMILRQFWWQSISTDRINFNHFTILTYSVKFAEQQCTVSQTFQQDKMTTEFCGTY